MTVETDERVASALHLACSIPKSEKVRHNIMWKLKAKLANMKRTYPYRPRTQLAWGIFPKENWQRKSNHKSGIVSVILYLTNTIDSQIDFKLFVDMFST
jgi:hypothetical protein